MDPASIVFGILGVFGTGASCYKAIARAASTNKDVKNLFWRLRVEECRFTLWGRAWGISPGSLKSKQLEDALIEDPELAEVLDGILRHVVDTMTGAEKLRSRVVKARDRALDEKNGGEPKETPEDMQRRDPLSWAKKMRWSMGDRASFTELIECLKEFNDGMYRLFPPKTRDTLDRALPPELLASTEDVVDLNAIEDASSGYPGLQTTAALKSISIRIEETPWTGSSIDRVASLQLILGQVNFPDWLSQPIQDGSGLRIITTYRASEIAPIKNVLIEMHRYDNKISPDLRLQLFFRVDKLARLLHTTPKPPDARVLDCLGWVDHPSYPSGPCVGFVYSIPLSTAQPQRSGSEPLSLQALLKQEKLPHLGTRFQLAQVLVRAILQLHAAGWLHKDLKSSNIIFFPESGSFQFPNLYITGFDFARPDGPDEISDIGGIVSPLSAASLYHHPEYSQNTGISNAQKKRFRRAYDVYALGCILLEIGLWRSLDSMWKPKYSPREFRERLVDNWAKELGGRCGERYQKVVEDCLMAGDEAEAHETKELREFVWGVVDQLEKLSV